MLMKVGNQLLGGLTQFSNPVEHGRRGTEILVGEAQLSKQANDLAIGFERLSGNRLARLDFRKPIAG